MPDGARPPDVQFDDAAAAAAIAELTSARRVLEETETVRTTTTRTASDEFVGAYADSFADASGGLRDEAIAALQGLVALRRTIDDAVDAAAQRRTEVAAAQAAWDAEAAEERRLREQWPYIPI